MPDLKNKILEKVYEIKLLSVQNYAYLFLKPLYHYNYTSLMISRIKVDPIGLQWEDINCNLYAYINNIVPLNHYLSD